MRALSERDDQCQAKLDIMVDAFMRDDWATYRHAAAWLRDFTHQKNIERGRVKSGGNWFMPQKNRGGEEARAHETREGGRSIARCVGDGHVYISQDFHCRTACTCSYRLAR